MLSQGGPGGRRQGRLLPDPGPDRQGRAEQGPVGGHRRRSSGRAGCPARPLTVSRARTARRILARPLGLPPGGASAGSSSSPSILAILFVIAGRDRGHCSRPPTAERDRRRRLAGAAPAAGDAAGRRRVSRDRLRHHPGGHAAVHAPARGRRLPAGAGARARGRPGDGGRRRRDAASTRSAPPTAAWCRSRSGSTPTSRTASACSRRSRSSATPAALDPERAAADPAAGRRPPPAPVRSWSPRSVPRELVVQTRGREEGADRGAAARGIDPGPGGRGRGRDHGAAARRARRGSVPRHLRAGRSSATTCATRRRPARGRDGGGGAGRARRSPLLQFLIGDRTLVVGDRGRWRLDLAGGAAADGRRGAA